MAKHRLLLISIAIAVVGLASLPFLMSASCLTRQQLPAEQQALDTLRSMTRNDVLPAEDAVAKFENAVSPHEDGRTGSSPPRTHKTELARFRRRRGVARYETNRGTHVSRRSRAVSARECAGTSRKNCGSTRHLSTTNSGVSGLAAGSRGGAQSGGPVSEKRRRRGGSPPVKRSQRKNDAAALLASARAYEQTGDTTRALASYRRLYFFASAATESADAATAIPKLGSTLSPANTEEAMARADRLYAAKRFSDALTAYSDAFAKFPATATAENQLRRGIAASNARKTTDAVSALNSIPTSAGDTRAEALFYLAQTYARARQWEQARATVEEMRRAFPTSNFTPRAFVAVGQIAKEAKNDVDAAYFLRAAVNGFSSSIEVAQAQFDLAWDAHEARNFAESSRMLTEHLAYYADKNTDNRGRAGYWAARDSERAGRLAEARALYEAMQGRYDANWYGYLAKQRLDVLSRTTPAKTFPPDSIVARAIANLQTVTVAEESAGAEADTRIVKADELSNVGLDELALKELAEAGANNSRQSEDQSGDREDLSLERRQRACAEHAATQFSRLLADETRRDDAVNSGTCFIRSRTGTSSCRNHAREISIRIRWPD